VPECVRDTAYSLKSGTKVAIAFARAKEAVQKIRRHADRCLVIHYSSQSLYDDREGLSPRVANIVVKDFKTDQTVSFAIPIVAERLHIAKEEIPGNLDAIESALLQEFYDFVRDRSGSIWLHWNMINIQYGFETLSHRYFVLTGKSAPAIDIDNRINIAAILHGLYGDGYVSKPHMQKLMQLNGGVRRDFVVGLDEVTLFAEGKYAQLHASTVSKVRFFGDVIELVMDRKLHTERANVFIKIERSADSLWAKIVTLIAALFGIGDGILRLTGH
jgi:hypothetical protein